MMAGQVVPKASLILDLPPSCVQYCQAHPDYLVIGTYNLQKDEDQEPSRCGAGEVIEPSEVGAARPQKPQSRNGSLLVFRTGHPDLTHVQTEPQPSALLDVRFHPAPDRQEVLAVVSSTGTLAIFRLEPNKNPHSPLKHIATSSCDDLLEDTLFLQCCWHPSEPRVVGVTTSTGAVRLLRLGDDWKIAGSVDLDIPNSLEAWSIAMAPEPAGPHGPTTVYCGGDDSMLRYNSYSVDGESQDLLEDEPAFSPITIKGQHDAGVTAILPLTLHEPDGGRLVVTGSYDDHVRLLSIHDPRDSYGMKRVRPLAEENLGGGVWRLDLVDVDSSNGQLAIRILASCMYAGARLIRLSRAADGSWACTVLAQFEEHQSMNYGCAVVPSNTVQNTGRVTCISTSFYDRLLCLWEYNPVT